MSLAKEAFEAAIKLNNIQNKRVNTIFQKLGKELSDKVQMDHYGRLYLFGKKIASETTDEEIISIINTTSEKDDDGYINFFGEWTTEPKQ
ncbi:MAG: hypothetical protein WCQ49_01810 [Candidatus Saccharibacteria bacterium]